MKQSDKILEVKNLNVYFKTYAGVVKAVRGVDFHLNRGETLAIVGESGCGKTVTAKAIMDLLPKSNTVIDGGESITGKPVEAGKEAAVLFKGEDILKYGESEMTKIRGRKISMIFQDPMTSLNPTMKIGEQIAESVFIHEGLSMTDAKKVALNMLDLVRLPNAKERMEQYPFELSGGMRQRIMIAIALACNPEVLIADEPTTALDVTIQAQIMELIKDLQREMNTGVILVTHDLGVVASVADRIQVMYAGKILERGDKHEIFYKPKHPYTYSLLKSVPKLTDSRNQKLYSLVGTPPDLTNPPKGCPFAARCEFAMEICRMKHPMNTEFSKTQSADCWLQHPSADLTGVPELLQGGAADGQ